MMLPRFRTFIALFPILSLASCSQLGALGDALAPYTPKLQFKDLSVRGIDFTKVDVDFLFDLHNPNPLAVKLATFSYDLGLEGVEVVRGTNDQGLELKRYGDTQLAIPVSLTFANILDLVKNVKGKDDLGFTIGGELGFNTPVGVARVPFNESGRFPLVHTPSLSLDGLRIAKLDLIRRKASLELDVGIANPDGGKNALSLAGFQYGLALGGAKVASGVRDALPALEGGGKQTVALPIDLDLKAVGTTLVKALTGKSALDVQLDGVLQVGTAFGNIPLSFDQLSKLVPR